MKQRYLVLAVVCLMVSLVGCGGGGGGNKTSADGGTLRVSVTDAPFPASLVASATILIKEVSVRRSGGGGFTNVFSGSRTIDLVPLTGGVSEQLVEASIPPGTYDEARVVVDAGEVVLKEAAIVSGDSRVFNTDRGNLSFPSGSQTGIKVKIDPPIEVVSRLSVDLILDFDLDQNFVFNGPMNHAPGVKRVLFTPVVRAVNASTAGRIAVTVLGDNTTPEDNSDDPLLEGATVTAIAQHDGAVVGAATDAAGLAEIALAPGRYDVVIEIDGYDSARLEDVEVFLANVTDREITLAATSGQISGTVMDDSDTVLPGVAVTLFRQGETASLSGELTDVQGAFHFDSLAPGLYDLTFSKEGFVTQTLEGVVAVTAGASSGPVILQAE